VTSASSWSLGLRTSRTGRHRGSAMGAHYRHTAPEMAARIATAIEQRLRLVLEVAEQALVARPNRSLQRVFSRPRAAFSRKSLANGAKSGGRSCVVPGGAEGFEPLTCPVRRPSVASRRFLRLMLVMVAGSPGRPGVDRGQQGGGGHAPRRAARAARLIRARALPDSRPMQRHSSCTSSSPDCSAGHSRGRSTGHTEPSYRDSPLAATEELLVRDTMVVVEVRCHEASSSSLRRHRLPAWARPTKVAGSSDVVLTTGTVRSRAGTQTVGSGWPGSAGCHARPPR
jgi:hypothetical protein